MSNTLGSRRMVSSFSELDEETFIYVLCAVIGFFMLLSFVALSSGVVAPYGRYSGEKSLGINWGVAIPAKPAWIIQEAPSLLIPLMCVYIGSKNKSVPNIVLVSYFIIHYFNRVLIYPIRMRGGKPSPMGVVVSAFLFTSVNGYINGRYLSEFAIYNDGYLQTPCFIIGSLLFWGGLFINHQSDSILRRLRKPGESGYKIPHGGMFTYISGANFFGEILEWIGFAVATKGAIPAATFAACTFFNIAPRAVSHHDWYMAKFDEYGALGRKRLIPFIY